jgi:aerobic-type carbon monoxide dehydrogenase small subunit (CoxS/CutS family)
MNAKITLNVNNQQHTITTTSDHRRRRSLLDVLREDLRLTGTKYGCGEGDCGACTVLIDGKRARSCGIVIDDVVGKSVVTIEGLSAAGDASLHPVQQAFLDEGAFQCGYCTPGMIMSAVALLDENPTPTDSEIVEYMNGNLCRCCGYPRILSAIRKAAGVTGDAGE